MSRANDNRRDKIPGIEHSSGMGFLTGRLNTVFFVVLASVLVVCGIFAGYELMSSAESYDVYQGKPVDVVITKEGHSEKESDAKYRLSFKLNDDTTFYMDDSLAPLQEKVGLALLSATDVKVRAHSDPFSFTNGLQVVQIEDANGAMLLPFDTYKAYRMDSLRSLGLSAGFCLVIGISIWTRVGAKLKKKAAPGLR
jgi:hypothetical protein